MYCFYLFVLLVAVGLSGAAASVQVRRARGRVVLQTLASIVAQNLPLPMALRAAARAERGRMRRVFERLVSRLEEGQSLSDALRRTVPGCPGHVIGALRGAECGGTTASVLQSLAARSRRERWPLSTARRPAWYSLVMLICLPAIMIFVMCTVVPKFREIFLDYGTTLPPATVRLLEVATWLAQAGPVVPVLIIVLLLVLAHVLLVAPWWPRVPDRIQLSYALVDWLAWHVPMLQRAIQAGALVHQLPILSAGLRAGHPLHQAARQAGHVAVNGGARRRLLRWARRLEEGAEPAAAARRAGLPAPLRRALEAARHGTDLPAALDYLAEYYRALVTHWENVAASLLTPAVVIFWALCVGFTVVALFMPLARLTESVLSSVY